MRNGKAVVLVVEDELLVRMDAVNVVLEAGYEVEEAAGADEAIRILTSRDDVELVFTDVQMPGTMDGCELARYIELRWPRIGIIVTSGVVIPETRTLPLNAGFLSKPYNSGAILEEMALMISVSQLFGDRAISP